MRYKLVSRNKGKMFRNSVPNLTTIKHELPIPIYLQLYFQGEETESSAMFFADNGSELRGNILRPPKCPCGHWPKGLWGSILGALEHFERVSRTASNALVAYSRRALGAAF